MKRFTAVTLAALMVLAVFASLASAASVGDTVEIRSNVYTDYPLTHSQNITINSSSFAGFYYDLDDDISSETMTILAAGYDGNREIEDDPIEGLEYQCDVVTTDYEYDDSDWANKKYPVMGFFAEEYVPLFENDDGNATSIHSDKLAKLILDSDDKHTLTTGESLDLGDGYTLEAKQVDVDGDKVWLEFDKDGEFIDDEVVDVSSDSTNAEHTWTVDLDDVEDEDNVVVLKVHVDQVFQGSVDSIAQIEGLWLIDYQNAFTIDDGDEYGNLEVDTSSDTGGVENLGYIKLNNKDNSITLSKDSEKSIAEGLYFKVADNSTVRFYLMKQYTEPGEYEIRGTVVNQPNNVNGYPFTWNYSNFAGFYYDLDDNIYSEELDILVSSGRKLEDDSDGSDKIGITYYANVTTTDYEYDESGVDYWDNYQFPVIGFFAEEYVPLFDKDAADSNDFTDCHADKLAKLILDSDDKYTLTTGDSLDLGDGYTLEAKQVDVDGDKVWLEFDKDGEFIDDEVIDVSQDEVNDSLHTWTVDLDDIEDEDNIVVLKVHVDQVFQGSVDSIAQIEGLWLIDYQNAFTIDDGDEYGNLEVDSIMDGTGDYLGGLKLNNKDNSVTLTKDSDKHIAGDMYFKVADDGDYLRFYPYVERTIEGEGTTKVTETEVPTGTAEVNETAPVENVTTPGGEEAPTAENEGTPAAETTTTEGESGTPGFGIVLGLAGLLSVVYLVRRN